MIKLREFFASASGILSFVLTILGVVFLGTGAAMTILGTVSQVAGAPSASSSVLWGVGVVFLIVGGIAGGVGIVMGMRRRRLLRLRELLRTYGYSTDATIVHVSQNIRVRVNRRHPWLILYQYKVSGVAYNGQETMFEMPTQYIVGATVAIRYDPNDPAQSALEQV
jgi:hypothetical protein